jgi:hypothetical protein
VARGYDRKQAYADLIMAKTRSVNLLKHAIKDVTDENLQCGRHPNVSRGRELMKLPGRPCPAYRISDPYVFPNLIQAVGEVGKGKRKGSCRHLRDG